MFALLGELQLKDAIQKDKRLNKTVKTLLLLSLRFKYVVWKWTFVLSVSLSGTTLNRANSCSPATTGEHPARAEREVTRGV